MMKTPAVIRRAPTWLLVTLGAMAVWLVFGPFVAGLVERLPDVTVRITACPEVVR